MPHRTGWKLPLILALGIALGAAITWAAEPHPAIRTAQKDLRHAKEALEHADHDFAGHRVKAIEAINTALDELKLALEADRK